MNFAFDFDSFVNDDEQQTVPNVQSSDASMFEGWQLNQEFPAVGPNLLIVSVKPPSVNESVRAGIVNGGVTLASLMKRLNKTTKQELGQKNGDRRSPSSKKTQESCSDKSVWSEWLWKEESNEWYRFRVDANGKFSFQRIRFLV
jgi:hypothetical protein